MQLAIITLEVVRYALDLRKQLESLKAMDSLQLGTAMTCQCDIFITNDKRLTQLKQLQIITLDQWK
jgi:predicted nucleic acid-binding protein